MPPQGLRGGPTRWAVSLMHELWFQHHVEQLFQESPAETDMAKGASVQLYLNQRCDELLDRARPDEPELRIMGDPSLFQSQASRSHKPLTTRLGTSWRYPVGEQSRHGR
jgi:hypothetical protein